MKTLIITRHAKSDWSNLYLQDFDRVLNDRGMRDAPFMGQKFLRRSIPVDLILSSTAKRAEQTATLIAHEMAYDVNKIKWTKDLYHASAQEITEQILGIDNDIDSVMIVCHNPGITNFVNMQCGTVTENVPTCGMTGFEIHTDKWEEFPMADKRFLFHDFPKNQ